MSSAYVEARLGIAPQFYIAGRFGIMDFSEIDVAGQSENWDDDLWRWEAAVGYRMAREVLIRVKALRGP